MITLTKSGNAIVFTFDDNDHYLNDGIIEVPVNSLTLVTDDSQMATFRKSASNDIFISATYDELGMSKADLESWFKENAFDTGITQEEVQDMIDESISGKVNTTDFNTYSAATDARLSEDEEVTSAALNALNEKKLDASAYTPTDLSNYYTKSETSGATQISTALASKADTSAVTEAVSSKMDTSAFNTYSANTDARLSEDEEVTAAALNSLNSNKQDKLTAGENITINGNVISAAGGNNVIELTQAEYDKLTDIDPDAFYIITDADGGVTTGQVQTMIDDSISGKADTATTYTKTEVDNAITAATSTKQDTLVSGTNIKTINNESLLGSGNIDIQGGGKAISAGTNISVTTGETADTINCTLPYYKLNDNYNYSIYGQTHPTFINKTTNAHESLFIGNSNEVNGDNRNRSYTNNKVLGNGNIINGHITDYSKGYNIVIGYQNSLSGTNLSHSYVIGEYNSGYTSNTLLTGWYNQVYNGYESVFGHDNNSVSGSSTFGDSGNTLFSVGNGAYNARHNAFEIRQNGDIYIADTNDTTYQNYYEKPMVRLQDVYGALGGLKLVQISQSDYDALATKDASTLYLITGSN